MAPGKFPLSEVDFYYHSFGLSEPIEYYVPGGFHPIVIGDILASPPAPDDAENENENENKDASRRYRIMHKLGYGSYATVWLAEKLNKDSTHHSWVALKVTSALPEHIPGNEATMLKAIQPPFHSNHSHVLELIDDFVIRGPNGVHSVLVTDIVVPILDLLSWAKPTPQWRKAVVRGLIRGVAQMHAGGVVHGDLHLGNIGVAFPTINAQTTDPQDVLYHLGDSEMTVVLPYSAALQSASLPAYIIAPAGFAVYYNELQPPSSVSTLASSSPSSAASSSCLPQTKILDFGSAHPAGTLPTHFQCSKESVAPEVVFPKIIQGVHNPPVEPPADIWGLATAIYQIVSGRALLSHASFHELPEDMLRLTGSSPHTQTLVSPTEWAAWYSKRYQHSQSHPDSQATSSSTQSKSEFTPAPTSTPTRTSQPQKTSNEWWSSHRPLLRAGCANERDTDLLIELLQRMLVLDPERRPSAAQVLEGAWLDPAEEGWEVVRSKVRRGVGGGRVYMGSGSGRGKGRGGR